MCEAFTNIRTINLSKLDLEQFKLENNKHFLPYMSVDTRRSPSANQSDPNICSIVTCWWLHNTSKVGFCRHALKHLVFFYLARRNLSKDSAGSVWFRGEKKKSKRRHSSGSSVQCWRGCLLCCGLWRAIHHGEWIPQSSSHRARLLGQIKGSTVETLSIDAAHICHLLQRHPRLSVGQMLSLANSSIMATDSLSLFSFFHFHPRPRVTSSHEPVLLGLKASHCSMKLEARFMEEFSSPTTYCCTWLYWHLVFRPQAANCGSSRSRDCESLRKSFFNQERFLHSKSLAGKKKLPSTDWPWEFSLIK